MTASFAVSEPPCATSRLASGKAEIDLFRRATALARFGVWSCELDSERLWWSDGVYDLFGLPRGGAIDRETALDFYAADSRRELAWRRRRAVHDHGSFSLDAQINLRDGSTRWMRILASVEQDSSGRRRLYGTKQDVTEEKQLAERLRILAESDPLTSLANRGVFEAWLKGSGTTATASNVGALALIDIDRFKLINDVYGHALGDTCLRYVAAQLRLRFADAPLLARIGGDEFALLSPAGCGQHELAARLTTLIADLAAGAGGAEMVRGVGVSVGLAMLGDDCRYDSRELYAAADAALYAAKAAGRATLRTAEGFVGAPVQRSA